MSRGFLPRVRVLVCALLAGCYRTETAFDYVLACPAESDVQRIVIPFKIEGMGSAHYPGPPYSCESFDVLEVRRSREDLVDWDVIQVHRYQAQWPLEKVRGSVLTRAGGLSVNL